MARKPATIDEYLAACKPAQREALGKLRKTICAIVPQAVECISYGMPAFRVDGRVVAGFAATSSGCSYYPFSGTTLDGLGDLLDGYSRTKSALHIAPGRSLPATLVRALIRARRVAAD
jgi:uncharacterized protein YdhG (YjbR/CyaY superfamily)